MLSKNLQSFAKNNYLRNFSKLVAAKNSVLSTTKNKFVTTVDINDGQFSFSAGLPSDPYGGLGNGPKPLEILLSSYATCSSLMGKYIAKDKGYPLQEIKCKVTYQKEGEVDQFLREIEFIGEGLTDEMKKTLIGGINSCPVHDILHNTKKETITKMVN
ncbi:PROTEIN INVOLVED IN RIMO-MEDIATED BETA-METHYLTHIOLATION OF ribosomal protein S12 YCAO [Anaeramoeba flamelloides]|uniref:PROTEIN INVOLVED IN RIMO-MEDIATED BETA-METHYLTHIOLATION OF ribosomal protein S12 YCAO n=1 Tax=Anaeramoeba flamelloides TaxID=1746091 RepID=A0ABQ8YHG7_9EUKA|nr:PROTEIN INVOLVED IN RIMO-MEDIATED BETA-METHYLTHIOLATION OF ribosomal protein S12 YCAO [Anaeramoeba flamelloides]